MLSNEERVCGGPVERAHMDMALTVLVVLVVLVVHDELMFAQVFTDSVVNRTIWVHIFPIYIFWVVRGSYYERILLQYHGSAKDCRGTAQ